MTDKPKHVWIYSYKIRLSTVSTLIFLDLTALEKHVTKTMTDFDEPIVYQNVGTKVWYYEDEVCIKADRKEVQY